MIMIFVAGFIAGCIATLFVLYILSFFDGHIYDGPKQIKAPQQCFRIGSPVIVTEGPYQGMYGTIEAMGASPDRFMIYFPRQTGTRADYVHLDAKVLRINVPEETMIEIEEKS